MEEQSVEGTESVVEKQAEPQVSEEPNIPDEPKGPKRNKKIMLWGGAALAVVLIGWGLVYLLLPKAKEVDWFSNQMIAIYIAAGLVGGGILAGFLFKKPLRTRLSMQKIIKEDVDINDWLVIFSWTPKILYVPTIVASFFAAALSCFDGIQPAAIGGIWAAIFFLNFLIEEYNITIKILLIAIVSTGFFLLWLHLLGWVVPFLKLFQKIALSVSPPVYLFVGTLGLLAVFISWLQGLFYYVTITPNYMNLQEGPTESGEQIGREDYNSRIDTSDFLERLMGFGRIIITFKERKRQPIVVLVWRIQKKAQMLERVRAKFAIDHQPRMEPLK